MSVLQRLAHLLEAVSKYKRGALTSNELQEAMFRLTGLHLSLADIEARLLAVHGGADEQAASSSADYGRMEMEDWKSLLGDAVSNNANASLWDDGSDAHFLTLNSHLQQRQPHH